MTEAPPRPVLRLTCLNDFQAHIDDHQVTLTTDFGKALLVRLAFAQGNVAPRSTVQDLFWPDSELQKQQVSLRGLLHRLRTAFRACGVDPLPEMEGVVGLGGVDVRTDVGDIFDALAAGDPTPAGTVAPDFRNFLVDLRKLPDTFEEWSETLRREQSARLIWALESACAKAPSAEARLAFARILEAADPFHEGACQAIIRAYSDLGQVANALTAYQAFWNRLDEEFGEEPSSATQSLYVAVKSSTHSVAPAPLEDDDARPRILVDAADDTKADAWPENTFRGVRSEFISSLVRFREWRIVDAARIAPAALQQIMDHPRVYQTRLEIIPHPTRMRLAITLANANSGDYVFSQVVDAPAAEFHMRQPEIVRQIAIALSLNIAAPDPGAADAPLQLDQLYDKWLEAEGQILTFMQTKWSNAEVILDDVIAQRPDFVRALASRAGMENLRQISFPGVYTSPDAQSKALSLASRAVELDPLDSRAQLALAWSCAMSRQFERAELAYNLAYQHNENDPWTMVSAAVGLAFCGQAAPALRLSETAMRLLLNPNAGHWSYHAATCFLAGDYTQCVAASEKAQEISPDVPAWHAAALSHLGDAEQAKAVGAGFIRNAVAGWAGDAAPEPEDVTRWVLRCFPIRRAAAWTALRDGLAGAQLPIPALPAPAA